MNDSLSCSMLTKKGVPENPMRVRVFEEHVEAKNSFAALHQFSTPITLTMFAKDPLKTQKIFQ